MAHSKHYKIDRQNDQMCQKRKTSSERARQTLETRLGKRSTAATKNRAKDEIFSR